MRVSRFVVACSSVLTLLGAQGCSDKSDSTSDAGQINATPFAFLSGKYGVGVQPRFASCGGEVYFSQELWVVSSSYATVAVMTIPDTSLSPQLLTPTVDSEDGGDAGAQAPIVSTESQAASSGGPIPPTFRGDMGSTLKWRASLDLESTTQRGCLSRRSTVLELQFTPEGNVIGSRSIFNDYSGGEECTGSCRLAFAVQGAKQTE